MFGIVISVTLLEAPTWMVDAAQLRQTLDRMRTALEKPTARRAFSDLAVGYDRDSIVATINAISAAVSTTDLEARRALMDVVVEYRTHAQSNVLRGTVEQLAVAVERRVANAIRLEKKQALHGLLGQAVPDLLTLLAGENKENAHSDVLRWLLDPACAPTVGPLCLERLVDRLPQSEDWKNAIRQAVELRALSVRRELQLTQWSGETLDRIDIAVSGPGFIIAIENKLWSQEHADQTTGYWTWLEQLGGLRAGIFLSPTGAPAQSDHFVALSYLDLVEALLEAPSRQPIEPQESIVLASYLKTLERYVLRAELRAAHPSKGTRQ